MSSPNNSAIAVFDTHERAEAAIRALQKDGFDMKKLSIVGRDIQAEEHVVGYYSTGDRMLSLGKFGASWGGFWALLFGSAFFVLPGVGPLLVGGPLVAWIVAALGGAAAVEGASALGAAFYSIGIPHDSVLDYETEIKSGKLLLIAHGSPAEAARAKELLGQAQVRRTILHAEPELALAV